MRQADASDVADDAQGDGGVAGILQMTQEMGAMRAMVTRLRQTVCRWGSALR